MKTGRQAGAGPEEKGGSAAGPGPAPLTSRPVLGLQVSLQGMLTRISLDPLVSLVVLCSVHTHSDPQAGRGWGGGRAGAGETLGTHLPGRSGPGHWGLGP